MPFNRWIKYLYTGYCRIYWCRGVEYIDAEGSSCPLIGGLNTFVQDIVEYIDVEGSSCPLIGGLNTFIQDIVEYIDVEV
jgi:hypothetical protein